MIIVGLIKQAMGGKARGMRLGTLYRLQAESFSLKGGTTYMLHACELIGICVLLEFCRFAGGKRPDVSHLCPQFFSRRFAGAEVVSEHHDLVTRVQQLVNPDGKAVERATTRAKTPSRIASDP